ncbi:MAG: hypothetical protein NUK65_11785 [Firmicutes bacterium]|nr:hypothetical protein [Bacillota bacterium]
MCHRETGFEFAILNDNELSSIRETEAKLNTKERNTEEVILLAYKRADDNRMDR